MEEDCIDINQSVKANTDSNRYFTTPVLFLIFNRPDTTRKVFEAIRCMRPSVLYIAADGPRPDRLDDLENCNAARDVVSMIDWDCKVTKLFREENLGCGLAISSAITWYFEHEVEGIILEDDCEPSPDFFRFCSEMLERYRDDTRIMGIGGNNFEPIQQRKKYYSYYFSQRIYIWGWATWRRAWSMYNFEMTLYPEIKSKGYLKSYYDHLYEKEHSDFIWDKIYSEEIKKKTTWDYQWQFVVVIKGALTIVPERNLIKNIGFGTAATNTSDPLGAGHNLKMEPMDFPLRHPEFMMVEKRRDHWYFNSICISRAFRVRSWIKNLIPRPLFELALPFYKSYMKPKDRRDLHLKNTVKVEHSTIKQLCL